MDTLALFGIIMITWIGIGVVVSKTIKITNIEDESK